MITKICSKCGLEKNMEDFHRDAHGKQGRKSRCKSCIALYMLNRKNVPGVKESLYQNGRKYDRNNPEARMANSARERAKASGIPCEITKQDIVIPEMCPILGIYLERGNRKAHDSAPSLDRIIPEVGYVLGNTNVISYRANRIKNDGTAREHLRIADWMDSISSGTQLDTFHEEIPE